MISDEVACEPDPRIFEAALNQLKVLPDEAIYVGDSLETDVLGADRAGIVSVRLVKQGLKRTRLAADMQPKLTIQKISELLRIVKNT